MTKTKQDCTPCAKKRRTGPSALETLRADVEERFLRIERHFALPPWEEISVVRAAFAKGKTE
jgi:hypothetical protein